MSNSTNIEHDPIALEEATQNNALEQQSQRVVKLQHYKKKSKGQGFCLHHSELRSVKLNAGYIEHDLIPIHAIRKITFKQKESLAGISIKACTVRDTTLPFDKTSQIAAVLPQQAADQLMYPPQKPRFTFIAQKTIKHESKVLYAIIEQEQLSAEKATYEKFQLKVKNLVIQEQACWPLLKGQNKLGAGEQLLVDCSALPYVVLHVDEERLLAIHSIDDGEPESSALEIAELANSMLTRMPQIEQVLWVGPEYAAQAIDHMDVIPLTLEALELDNWQWLRPTGLAYAAANQKAWANRLLSFSLDNKNMGASNLSDFKPAIWVGTCAIVLMTLGLLIKSFWMQWQVENTEAKIAEQFYQQMSALTPINDPIRQLSRKLKGAGAQDALPPLHHVLFIIQKAVPGNTKVQWESFSYQKKGVQLQGEVANFDLFQRVRTALQKTESITSVDTLRSYKDRKLNTVKFQLRLNF